MGNLIMSNKEREQVKVFELLTNKAMTQKAASIRLKMTTRGIRKKIKRFKEYLEMVCGHPRKTDLNTESEGKDACFLVL